MTDRRRRPGPTVRARVREVVADGEHRHEDRLATEEPLEIRLAWPGSAARRLWVTMRTPGNDFELAAGYLLHEGLVSRGDIRTVAYCTDVDLAPEQEFNVVTVELERPPRRTPAEPASGLSAGSSACGVCGHDSIAEALHAPVADRWAGPAPTVDVVRRLPGLLREHQQLFGQTGGIHGAGLFTAEGEVIVVREDIGRHNAVDKVTGARMLAGHDPAAAVLVVSGRAGFELAQKAVAAGVGTLVAVGAPSSLAVSLAREAGLGLVGFTRADRCVVYV